MVADVSVMPAQRYWASVIVKVPTCRCATFTALRITASPGCGDRYDVLRAPPPGPLVNVQPTVVHGAGTRRELSLNGATARSTLPV